MRKLLFVLFLCFSSVYLCSAQKLEFQGIEVDTRKSKFVNHLKKRGWIEMSLYGVPICYAGTYHHELAKLYVSDKNGKVTFLSVTIKSMSRTDMDETINAIKKSLTQKFKKEFSFGDYLRLDDGYIHISVADYLDYKINITYSINDKDFNKEDDI